MKTHAAMVLVAALAAGCGRDAGSPKQGQPAEKGVMQTAVEGFTGKTAVDAGQKAKAEIKRIAAERDRNLEEVTGE